MEYFQWPDGMHAFVAARAGDPISRPFGSSSIGVLAGFALTDVGIPQCYGLGSSGSGHPLEISDAALANLSEAMALTQTEVEDTLQFEASDP